MVCLSSLECGGKGWRSNAQGSCFPQGSADTCGVPCGGGCCASALDPCPATLHAEYTGFSWVRLTRISDHSEAACETNLKLREYRARESVALIRAAGCSLQAVDTF